MLLEAPSWFQQKPQQNGVLVRTHLSMRLLPESPSETVPAIFLGADRSLMARISLRIPPRLQLQPAPPFKKPETARTEHCPDLSRIKAARTDVRQPQSPGLRIVVRTLELRSLMAAAEPSPTLRVGLVEQETSLAAMELGTNPEGVVRQHVAESLWAAIAGIMDLRTKTAILFAAAEEAAM